MNYANLSPCPNCGSRREPIVHDEKRAHVLLCSECLKPLSTWSVNW